MVKKFVFAGKSSDEFNCFLSGEGTYAVPVRDVEMVDIPGRNGQLIIDHGRYSNITYSYKLRINGQNAKKKAEDLSHYLMAQVGYKKLEDDYNPGTYRMASLVDISWTPFANKAMDALVQFNAKPQKFMKTGEHPVTVTTGAVLMNPTDYESKPLIRVVGTGTIQIGTKTMTVTQAGTNYIDLDAELMDAYEGTTNMNPYVSGTFPTLQPGANTITITGFSSVKITPRWWTI